MKALVDTSILTKLANKAHPRHQVVFDAVAHLLRKHYSLVLFPQILYEFFSVATRKKTAEQVVCPACGFQEKGGLGRTIEEALEDLESLRDQFGLQVLHAGQDLREFETWAGLVRQFRIRGVRTHDARLVAQMQLHGIRSIVTDDSDFDDMAEKKVSGGVQSVSLYVLKPEEILKNA
jgi:predicted nucleic acid-binding protein